MSIFLNQDSKVIVQGMTGSEGMKHTTRMLASGTAVHGVDQLDEIVLGVVEDPSSFGGVVAVEAHDE